MKKALIGHTGFVGSNLLEQTSFDSCFNSKNIELMAGKRFDLVVCAGVSAVKWKANKNPDADWSGIKRLVDVLRKVRAERFLLISTVDVYPHPERPADETADCRDDGHHAYGRHRLRLEELIMECFPRCHIVRLPALFGPGLRKNVIFDLMNDNCLDAINPESAFQWYDTRRLWRDLGVVLENDLPVVNFAVEPFATRRLIEARFPEAAVGSNAGPVVRYDIRSRHAQVWPTGDARGYMLSADAAFELALDYIDDARLRAMI